MFDPTEFEKLQQQLSANLDKTLKKFEKAFESLPDKIRKAFDSSFAARFEKTVKGIEEATGETVKELEKAIDRSKKYGKILDDQAEKVQDIIDKTREKAKNERAHLKNLAKSAKTIDEMLELEEKALEIQDKKNAAVAKLKKLMDAINAAQQGNLAKQNALNIKLTQANIAQRQGLAMQRAFGMSLGQLKNKAQQFYQTWANIGGAITGASIAVGLLVKQMLDGYAMLRRKGFDSYQAFTHVTDVTAAQFSGATQGVFASNKTFAASHGNIANNLGQIDMNRGLVIEATKLTTQYGVAEDAASHLVSQLNRISNFQAKVATDSVKYVRALSDANKIPVGTVMQELAKHTEAVAMYAGRGVASLAKGLITTRQMGVEFSKISGFADSLVNDFEGSLKMQAELQTVLPGLDLSQVMYDSQFGTDADVAKSLKAALQGTGLKNLDQLPRSIRNKLVSSLGLGAEGLQNILGTGSADERGFSSDTSGYSDTARSFGNSIGDMITKSKLASGALALLAAWATKVALTGSVGGLSSAVAGGAGVGAIAKGAAKTGALAAVVGGGIEYFNSRNQGASVGRSLARSGFVGAGAGVGAVVGGLIGTLAGPLGTMVGASIGGYLGGKIGQWGANRFAAIQPNQLKYPDGMGLNNVAGKNSDKMPIDTSKLEGKLDKLIEVTASNKDVVMDGHKVGRVLVDSNSRR